jgi:hypothetical protein
MNYRKMIILLDRGWWEGYSGRGSLKTEGGENVVIAGGKGRENTCFCETNPNWIGRFLCGCIRVIGSCDVSADF